MRAAMDVTTRGQYVYRQSDHEQASRADVRGLEVPVSLPKPGAGCGAARHGEKEQREQCQGPGVFVTGGRSV